MGSIRLASIRKLAKFKWPNEIDAYLSVGVPPGQDTFFVQEQDYRSYFSIWWSLL